MLLTAFVPVWETVPLARVAFHRSPFFFLSRRKESKKKKVFVIGVNRSTVKLSALT